MELLATVDEVKRSIGITGATYDATLVQALAQVSRLVAATSGRRLLPLLATRYYDGNGHAALWLPEPWLAITMVSLSSDGGATYTALGATDWWASDGLTWDAAPYQLVALNPNGSYGAWYAGQRTVKIEGVLGWHSDYASAWELSGDSVQDTSGISASATTMQVTDADGVDARYATPRFSIGDLLRIESEYAVVTYVNATTNVVTLQRAAGGSTGATHAKSTPIHKFRPDALANEAAVVQTSRLFKRGQQAFADAGANAELGQLIYVKRLDPDVEAILMAGGLRRLSVG
jgi:hypothetical protein